MSNEHGIIVRETARVMQTHPRYDLRFPLLPPLRDLGVDLIPEFRFDLTGVASEEGKEALRAAVDHVYLVQRHGVYDFLAFLDLAFWALNEFCLGNVSF